MAQVAMLMNELSLEIAIFYAGGVALYGLALLLARRAHPIIAERGGKGWCTTFEIASWATFLCAVVCWPLGLFFLMFSHKGQHTLSILALWLGRIPVLSVVMFLTIGTMLLALSKKHDPTALYDEYEDRDLRFKELGVRQVMALLACLLIAGLMGDVITYKWGQSEKAPEFQTSEKTPEERRTERLNEALARDPNTVIEKLQ